jgi:hypothetical protein
MMRYLLSIISDLRSFIGINEMKIVLIHNPDHKQIKVKENKHLKYLHRVNSDLFYFSECLCLKSNYM